MAVTLGHAFGVGGVSGGMIVAFFAGMMVLQLLFVGKVMPETKNKSLEELGAPAVARRCSSNRGMG